jgi:hypothetical protein
MATWGRLSRRIHSRTDYSPVTTENSVRLDMIQAITQRAFLGAEQERTSPSRTRERGKGKFILNAGQGSQTVGLRGREGCWSTGWLKAA